MARPPRWAAAAPRVRHVAHRASSTHRDRRPTRDLPPPRLERRASSLSLRILLLLPALRVDCSPFSSTALLLCRLHSLFVDCVLSLTSPPLAPFVFPAAPCSSLNESPWRGGRASRATPAPLIPSPAVPTPTPIPTALARGRGRPRQRRRERRATRNERDCCNPSSFIPRRCRFEGPNFRFSVAVNLNGGAMALLSLFGICKLRISTFDVQRNA